MSPRQAVARTTTASSHGTDPSAAANGTGRSPTSAVRPDVQELFDGSVTWQSSFLGLPCEQQTPFHLPRHPRAHIAQAVRRCPVLPARAAGSIHISILILGNDPVGHAILAVLERKARAGVEVCLLLDSLYRYRSNQGMRQR